MESLKDRIDTAPAILASDSESGRERRIIRNEQKRRSWVEYLLHDGGRFHLKTRKNEEIEELKSLIPRYSARLQLNRKFYVCGG